MASKTTKRSSILDDLWVGLYDAATLIGKSIQHVRDCVRDGFIPAAVNGKYRAVDVATGALKARDHLAKQASQSVAATRIANARAAEIEQRIAARAKLQEVAAIERGLALIDHVLGPMRSQAQAVPPRVTKDLALRQQLERELNIVLDAAADRAASWRRSMTPAASTQRKPVARKR